MTSPQMHIHMYIYMYIHNPIYIYNPFDLKVLTRVLLGFVVFLKVGEKARLPAGKLGQSAEAGGLRRLDPSQGNH